MKILYISEIFPDQDRGIGVWGGGEKQFYEVSRRVAAMGHDVTVLTCRFPGQPNRETVEGMQVVRAGHSRDSRTGGQVESPGEIVSYLTKTVREALKIAPDLVHSNVFLPVIAAGLVRGMTAVPSVSTFHDIWSPRESAVALGGGARSFLGFAAGQFSVRLAAPQVITVSPQVKEKLVRRGIGEERITVVPNGVDLEALGSGRRNSGHQLLFVGRLVKSKNVDLLIRAFKEVRESVKDARLVVLGDGPERRGLRELALSLGLGDCTHFTGVIPRYEEVAGYFRESSVFVLPSVIEGEGIALKEAMAAGLPSVVAGAPLSGVRSVVQDGRNGFVVPPGDKRALVEKIVELLVNPDEALRLGEGGRRSVEDADWNRVATRTVEVYRRALAEAGRLP